MLRTFGGESRSETDLVDLARSDYFKTRSTNLDRSEQIHQKRLDLRDLFKIYIDLPKRFPPGQTVSHRHCANILVPRVVCPRTLQTRPARKGAWQ